MTHFTQSKNVVLRERGQALILACVTFLMLALMTMASFAVATAVQEKIRIQATADSVAHAIAVNEARAFNGVSSMNKSIASAAVGQMALHSWLAIAKNDVAMLQAGMWAMFINGLNEVRSIPKWNFQHIPHAIKAFQTMSKYNSEKSSAQNEIDSKMNDWNDALKAFQDGIETAHKEQKAMLTALKGQFKGDSEMLSKIIKESAPQAEPIDAVFQLSAGPMSCTLEGTSSGGGSCQESEKDAKYRQDIMESIANSSRNAFGKASMNPMSAKPYWNMADDFSSGIAGTSKPQKMDDIQGGGKYTQIHAGLPGAPELQSGNIDATMPFAGLTVECSNCDRRGIWFKSSVSTSGDDTGNGSRGTPCNGDSCFINMRLAYKDGKVVFPSTYAGLKQNLSKRLSGKENPWELKNGKATIALTKDGPSELRLKADGEGIAVSKGQTYYHDLAQANAAPNFFDPYWRARLSAFTEDDLKKALGAAGDTEGSQMAKGKAVTQ